MLVSTWIEIFLKLGRVSDVIRAQEHNTQLFGFAVYKELISNELIV